MAEEKIEYSLELDISEWSRGIDAAIRGVRGFDQAISNSMSMVDQFETKLGDISSSLSSLNDVSLSIDVSDDALTEIDDVTAALESIQDETVTIDVESDIDTEEGNIESAIADIDTTLDIDVESDAVDEASNIETEIGGIDTSVDIDIETDAADEAADVETAFSGIDAIVDVDVESDVDDEVSNIEAAASGADATTEIDVESDSEDEEKDITGMLGRLNKLAVINIALQLAPGAMSLINTLSEFTGVPAFFELDAAMRKIEATTGRILPGTRELIVDLYQTDLAQSIDQIATAVATADQLGVAQNQIGTATERAFDVMNVTGSDVNDTLRTMQQLVNLGLAKDFNNAADILVAGFQSGADRAGDLSSTLINYGALFNQMGLSGEQALSLINSGLDSGIRSGEMVGQTISTFRGNILDLKNQNVADAIKTLDLTDLREQFRNGEIEGSTFLDTVTTRLGQVEDAAARAQIQTDLFGTRLERAGDAARGLNTGEDAFQNIDNLAAESSATIRNDFGGSIKAFKRTISTEMADVLDDTFDFQARIDKAKEQIGTFLSEIKSGTGVFESIEIAFSMPGLTEKIESLQRGLTNFVIDLLSGLASLISAIGKIPGVDVSSGGLDKLVSTLGEGQFKIDLATADPQDLNEWSKAIQTAIDRGVEETDINTIITGKVQDLVASGDLTSAMNLANLGEQLGTQAFSPDLQAIEDFRKEIERRNLMGAPRQEQEAQLAEMIAAAETQASDLGPQIAQTLFTSFNDALAQGDPEGAAQFAQFLGELGQDPTGSLAARAADLQEFVDTAAQFEGLGFGLSAGITTADTTTTTLPETTAAIDEITTTVTENMPRIARQFSELSANTETELSDVSTNLDDTGTTMTEFADGATENITRITDGISGFANLMEVDGARITFVLDQILTKLGQVGMSGGLSQFQVPGYAAAPGGNVTTTNINQNNTFNNQTSAASANSGQAVANAVRGH